MTRIKRIFTAAAAAIIATGAVLSIALQQANQADIEPLNQTEWAQTIERINAQKQYTFFAGIRDGYDIPTASTGFLIGNCGGGVCTVDMAAMQEQFQYTYKQSQPISGWTLARIRAPKYIAKAWRQLAIDEPSNVKFFKSLASIKTACAAVLSAANCKTMLTTVHKTWKKADGTHCRNGRLYGPGVGGTESCTIENTDIPWPESVHFGQRPQDVADDDMSDLDE